MAKSRAAVETVPRGPQEVRTALVAACERLCEHRMPSSVSVRDVAAEARVTPGLVHHYFDSKDALLVATARSIARDITAQAQQAMAREPDSAAMVRAVWGFFDIRPAFRTIILWWVVEGRDVTALMGQHPFLGALAKLLRARDPDAAPVRAATIGTLLLSGALTSGANRAVGLEPDDPRLRAQLERLSVLALDAGSEPAGQRPVQVETRTD